VRGKGTKLREGCTKVRLSQDRMPILSPSPSLAIFPQIKLGEGENNPENNPEKNLGILCLRLFHSGKVRGAN
jgi:hypothetical protein